MLGIRLEGDLSEARGLLAGLAAAGAEIGPITERLRREGYWHVYTTLRIPDRGAATGKPVRVPATQGRPVEGRRRAIGGRPHELTP